MRTFDDIPQEVRRRVQDGQRVVLILLDALGAELLERHSNHPLLRRLRVEPLLSQFPSTTTAHVTTLHFGMPVGDHGLYEWEVLEPSLGELICPLRFCRAGSAVAGDLGERLDPRALAPGPTFYESLGATSLVVQPSSICTTPYTRMAARGAQVVGFADLRAGIEHAVLAGDARYSLVYWDGIDAAGHRHGPDSPQVARAIKQALDAVHAGTRRLGSDTAVLLTADHGQMNVSPHRIDYLDELWPELPAHLVHARPAGSSRAVFLHVRPGHRDEVIGELARRLGRRAEVLPAHVLFGAPGPRLLARLGDVAVLPAAGRQAWLLRAPGAERWVRGHHGGRSAAEMRVFLGEVSA